MGPFSVRTKKAGDDDDKEGKMNSASSEGKGLDYKNSPKSAFGVGGGLGFYTRGSEH